MKKKPDIFNSKYKKNKQAKALVEGYNAYLETYNRSISHPAEFWGEKANEYLTWFKKWEKVLTWDFVEPKIEWFIGGKLNASYNCLDRHLDKNKDKTAYFWEGDNPEEFYSITYNELYLKVNKLAAVLKRLGVKKGDRVILYLPMITELPVAMLACARIGAIHSVVFGGFSAESLASRIKNCRAETIITADYGFRGGKRIELLTSVRKAVDDSAGVKNIIVFNRIKETLGLTGNYHFWQELLKDESLPDYVEPEIMDAEDPLFILYTSGSTGSPKGLVHTHGGYLLQAAFSTRITFDLHDEEIFWCTADIGWITGHTYGVYGLLINGLTSVLFEGVPSYPAYDRVWSIVEKYKVNKFYTAPTLIRALAREGTDFIKSHDISSLNLLGTVGEPINPEAWRWYHNNVGMGKLPIIDTWWQTETGAQMITPLPGVAPLKPGSCSFPFYGVDPVIIDPATGEEVKFPDQEGALFIRKPWPAMARTVFGDHERYKETYFSTIPGLYFTGDGAKIDEDGYYWITGRIDDVINVSGHRLGTAEIESALVLHKSVSEAAVVGYPHDIKGQGIYAFVTLTSDTSPDESLKTELIKLVRTEIGPIATPDVIQWANALPKTRSGKIMRRLLKKIAADDIDNMGDVSTIADPAVLEQLIADRIRVKKD